MIAFYVWEKESILLVYMTFSIRNWIQLSFLQYVSGSCLVLTLCTCTIYFIKRPIGTFIQVGDQLWQCKKLAYENGLVLFKSLLNFRCHRYIRENEAFVFDFHKWELFHEYSGTT